MPNVKEKAKMKKQCMHKMIFKENSMRAILKLFHKIKSFAKSDREPINQFGFPHGPFRFLGGVNSP